MRETMPTSAIQQSRAPNATIFERFAYWATVWAGSSWAFAVALGVIIVWLVTGPIFGYSDTWQLIINTGTTIVTFLMVFLIQRSQNKESLALQLKLNEVIAALRGASNRLINVEDLSEDEVTKLHERYMELAKLTAQEKKRTLSHSIEEAEHPEKLIRKNGHIMENQ
jgi:low affinity Fe/Cu permease